MAPSRRRQPVAAAAVAAALLLGAAAAQTLVPVRYASYAEMLARMRALVARAPQFARLYSVQERHGLQSPGACGDSEPCAHWVLEITNFGAANASAVEPWGGGGVRPNDLAHRPQVFLSGNLHGDEQVGPMTLIHAAELLVGQRAAGGHPWADRIVDTRRLLVMPMTNPLGYHRKQRSENGMDPNRDFPFRQAPGACMTTLTARAVNEVWRENLVTAALTFHGGMQAIGYEWGSENHMDHASESPDDRAQFLYTHVMANMAGALRGERYPVDRINSIVYPVDGGMEDWAYGGSWDTPSQVVCTPSTYGGYPPDKTAYNDAQLRAFNVIIEASDDKRPEEASLGAIEAEGAVQALAVEGAGDGHVPRNMRLTFAAVDMAAPYVHVTRATATVARARARRALRRAGEGAEAAGMEGEAGAGGGSRRAASDAAAGMLMARRYAALQALADGERARRLGRRAEAEAARLQHPAAAAPAAALPRALTLGGSGPAPLADGYSNAPALASAPFAGPGGCVLDAGASARGGCGSAHRREYTQWLALAAPAAAEGGAAVSEAVTVRVGWDVGGAVSVDATSLLVGSWDPRVPPSWLTATPVHAADNADAQVADPVKQAAAQRLVGEHGLTPAEAARFVDYLHAWQLFVAGRVPLGRLPPGVALRHSPPRHGVTRWVFGSLGVQPTDNVDGPSVLGEHVEGSPDLARAPFLTRFADCFVATFASGASADAGARLSECGPPEGAPTADAAAAAAGSEAAPAASAAVVHALLAVPYAVVDANWRDQVSPVPLDTPPQSHMVNARTTSTWRKENNGYVVVGRLHAIGQPQFVGVEVPAVAGRGGGGDGGAGVAPAGGSAEPAATATPSPSSSPPAAAATVTASASLTPSASPSGSPSGSGSSTGAATGSDTGTPGASATPLASSSSSGSPSATVGEPSVSPSSSAAGSSAASGEGAAPAAAAATMMSPDAAAAAAEGGGEEAGDATVGEREGEGEGGDEEAEEAVAPVASPAAAGASGSPPPPLSGDGVSSEGGQQMGLAQVAFATAALALLAYFGAPPAARFARALVAGGGAGSQSSRAAAVDAAAAADDEDEDDGLDVEAHRLVAAGGGGRRGFGARGGGPGRLSRRGAPGVASARR